MTAHNTDAADTNLALTATVADLHRWMLRIGGARSSSATQAARDYLARRAVYVLELAAGREDITEGEREMVSGWAAIWSRRCD